MTQPVADDNDIFFAYRAGAVFHFVGQFARFKNHHLKMIGTMERDVPAAIHDQEANVNRIFIAEWPDVELLRVYVPIDKSIGAFPLQFAVFCHANRPRCGDDTPNFEAQARTLFRTRISNRVAQFLTGTLSLPRHCRCCCFRCKARRVPSDRCKTGLHRSIADG